MCFTHSVWATSMEYLTKNRWVFYTIFFHSSSFQSKECLMALWRLGLFRFKRVSGFYQKLQLLIISCEETLIHKWTGHQSEWLMLFNEKKCWVLHIGNSTVCIFYKESYCRKSWNWKRKWSDDFTRSEGYASISIIPTAIILTGWVRVCVVE